MSVGWLTWLRGRTCLQFSLRGLLILLTIACIGLALAVRYARQRQQAIASIKQLDTNISFAHERDANGSANEGASSSAPAWLRGTVGEEFFRSVLVVNFNAPFHGYSRANDENLADFRQLNEVKFLNLNAANMAGPGLKYLPRDLEFLSLSYAWHLGDEGVAHLKGMNKLRELRLNNTGITDKGMAELSHLAALESLQLAHTDITDAGLKHLESLKNLNRVDLVHTDVTSEGASRLEKSLPGCQVTVDVTKGKPPKLIDIWSDNYHPTSEEIILKAREFNGTIYADNRNPDGRLYRVGERKPENR